MMVLTLTPMRLHELLEEGPLHRGESGERGQLDDAEHLVLEHDRQHDQVRRAASPSPEEILT